MPAATSMRTFDNVLEAIGDTPLVRLRGVVPDGPEVYAKIESTNPGGSVKDRIGLTMIEAAEAEGLLEPGGTIIEGTSGNTGIGLAMVAALKGYEVIFTMPDKMAVEKERLLRAYGAEVIRCPSDVEPDDPSSYYSVAERLSEEIENAFYPNQYFNEHNPRAHIETTGPEIWRDTDGKLTHFVAGVGTGGTISGTGRYLKDRSEDVRIIGVDPEGSILADRHATGQAHPEKAHSYLTEGIGEDLIPDTVWFDVIDDMVITGDRASFEMARRLATEQGILCGSSSGSAVVGVGKAFEQGLIGDDALVVVLLPDTGERYLSKAFNTAWLKGKGLVAPSSTAGQAAVTPIPKVAPGDGLERIMRVAEARDVPAVAVVDGSTVLGTVSLESVYEHMLADEAARERTARELASEVPPKVSADTPLGNAAATLANHAALIVIEDGEPTGLLTRKLALAHMGRL